MTKTDLIAKLKRERYETADPQHSDGERNWRLGWNARADALVFDLSQGDVETGLAELASNAPGMSGVVAFDLSETGGEG